jgi:hypothetical protein
LGISASLEKSSPRKLRQENSCPFWIGGRKWTALDGFPPQASQQSNQSSSLSQIGADFAFLGFFYLFCLILAVLLIILSFVLPIHLYSREGKNG